MKAKARELSASLSRLVPVLKTRTTLPILSCAKLEAHEGKLTLMVTDLDVFASATCPCEGDLPPLCVDVVMLNYMVQHAGDEVQLNLGQDNRRLFVEGEGTAQLAIQNAEEFPPWPTEKMTKLGINPTELADAIKGVAWASDTHAKITIDIWREVVWVKTTKDTMEAAATDGKEFAYVNKQLICAPAEFIFPAKQAALLADALLVSGGDVVISETWVGTESDTYRVAVKLAEGKFVRVKTILDQQQRPLGVFQICRVTDTLQTIRTLGKDQPWRECILEFEPEQVRISYNGSNNQFKRMVPHKLEGDPTRIKLDTDRAIHVFSHVQPGAKAALGNGSIFFNDDNYRYALALIRGD